MTTMIVKVVLCILVPVMLLCGMLDKRSRYLVFALCGGCIMCLAAYYLNDLLYQATGCSHYYLTTTIAPFVEESLKLIPILIFAKFASKEKRPIVTCAFAVGIGFAIIENSYMLVESAETATISWMLARGIGAGLMHGMSTGITGIGIYLASKDKRLILTGALVSLLFATMYHGAFNAMIMTDGIKYFSIFIPLISYTVVLAVMNREEIKEFLKE